MSENEESQLKALTNEYAKIKKHNAILKKAFLEEQEKSSQLENKLKDLSLKISSANEEIDTLTFNNNRLIKRVQVLQEELENVKNSSSSGGWFGSGVRQELAKTKSELEQFKEELNVKIKENEELHIYIYNLKLEHKTIKEDIMERMEKLKSEIKEKKEILEQMNEEREKEKNKYMDEISSLQSSLSKVSDELNTTKATMALNEMELKATKDELTTKLKNLQKDFDRKVSFNDTSNEIFNTFNIPFYNPNIMSLHRILNFATIFSQHVNLFYSFENERCDKLSLLISDESQKQRIISLKESRNRFLELFTNFLSSTKRFLDNNEEKQVVVNFLTDLINEFDNLSNLYKQYIEMENTYLNYMTEPMKNINNSIYECVSQIKQNLVNLLPYCDEIVVIMKHRSMYDRISFDTLSTLKGFVINTFIHLRTCCKHFSELIQLEQNFVSTQDRIINEKKLSAMLDSISSWEKLTEYFKYFYNSISRLSLNVRGIEVPKDILKKNVPHCISRSKNYISKLNEMIKDHKSIPYEDQLKHLELIDQLKNELNQKNEDIKNLTNAYKKQQSTIETYKNELENVKETLKKKNKKISELLSELGDIKLQLNNKIEVNSSDLIKNDENIDTKSEPDLIQFTDETPHLQQSINLIDEPIDLLSTDVNIKEPSITESTQEISNESDDNWSFIVFDESGKQSNHLTFTEEESKREEELRLYYENKTNVLNSQIDIANKKISELTRRCIETDRKLRDALNKKDQLQKNLDELNKALNDAKEETESTRANLQEQLEVLSEHFVSVNEKISTYKEELDTLKRCTVRCGKCKTWNTIEWLMGEGEMGRRCSKGDHPTSFNFA